MFKTRKLILGIFFLFLLLFAFYLFRKSREKIPIVEEVEVARRDISLTVMDTGSIRADSFSRLSFKISGKIEKLFVQEEDRVKKGQVLARLDSYTEAKTDYERIKNLYEIGAAPEQQLETVRLAFESTELRAPFDGTITSVLAREGETVLLGSPILTISNLNTLQVETEIDETDIGKVKVGQPVKVSIDAYPNQTFTGKVKEIALETKDILKERGVTYIVKISLEPENVELRLGMTADIEIKVEERRGVLAIPVGSIFTDGNGGKWVFLLKDSKIEKREILTGLENDEYAEIVQGVSEGETVVMGSLEKLREGMKVRIQRAKR